MFSNTRLLLPCLLNMVVFIVGQVVITHGTGEGKWAGFTVMLVFCTNSALNPVLLLLCSTTIRFVDKHLPHSYSREAHYSFPNQ